MRIAVLASGNGSNFEALSKQFKNEVVLLITNKKDAYALKRAKRLGVSSKVVLLSSFANRKNYNDELAKVLKENKIDLVLLAGYMLILTPNFIKSFKNRILNIHPSLLPKYKGLKSIEKAFKSQDLVTGVTVHVVDEGLDSGKVILQKKLVINHNDTLAMLESNVHNLEHKVYPQAVKKYIKIL